jgi:hypothetical protein
MALLGDYPFPKTRLLACIEAQALVPGKEEIF